MWFFPIAKYQKQTNHNLSGISAALHKSIIAGRHNDRHSYNTATITEKPAENLIIIHWGHYGYKVRKAGPLYPAMYCRLKETPTGNMLQITIRPPYTGYITMAIFIVVFGLFNYLAFLKKDIHAEIIALALSIISLVLWMYAFNKYTRKYLDLFNQTKIAE